MAVQPRIKHHAGAVVVPLFVFVASIPVADKAYRMLGDRVPGELAGLNQSFLERNYKLAPNVATDANWSSGRFTVVTDGLGLRCDRERQLATRPGDRVDLLVMGDSQGFGQGLDYEASLVGNLAAMAAADSVRVANASVGGHYLGNQYEVVRWLSQQLAARPKRFLLLLTPYLITTAGDFSVAVVGEDGRLYFTKPNLQMRAMQWVKTHSVLYQRMRDALRALGVRPGAAVPRMFAYFPTGQAEQKARERLNASLRSLMEAEGLAPDELWIVYTPFAAELDFEPVERAAALEGRQADRDSPARIAESVAASLRLPYLDLRSTLAAQVAQGVPLSLRGDPHYSAPVSRACAAAIWKAVGTEAAYPARVGRPGGARHGE